MSKQRIPTFLSNPPFSPIPLFLEKTSHPHPYWKIKVSQSWNYDKTFENEVIVNQR